MKLFSENLIDGRHAPYHSNIIKVKDWQKYEKIPLPAILVWGKDSLLPDLNLTHRRIIKQKIGEPDGK